MTLSRRAVFGTATGAACLATTALPAFATPDADAELIGLFRRWCAAGIETESMAARSDDDVMDAIVSHMLETEAKIHASARWCRWSITGERRWKGSDVRKCALSTT